jgi:hypothetical protein
MQATVIHIEAFTYPNGTALPAKSAVSVLSAICPTRSEAIPSRSAATMYRVFILRGVFRIRPVAASEPNRRQVALCARNKPITDD